MKIFIFIIAVLYSISVSGQSFFWSHNYTLSGVCTAPSGTTSKTLYTGITVGGTPYTTTSTLTLSCEHWYLYNYATTGARTSVIGYTTSWNVGDSVYSQPSIDCSKVANGFYLFSSSVNAYNDTIYEVIGGVIASKQSPFGINSYFGGGYIGYVLQSGDPGYSSTIPHGLIVYNATYNYTWGANTTTGATGSSIGTGNANTNTIVGVYGAGTYPAKLAYDLSSSTDYFGNVYSDYYLPSENELLKLFVGANCPYPVSSSALCLSLFWSSTEVNSSNAITIDGYYDTSNSTAKSTGSIYSIFVRSF